MSDAGAPDATGGGIAVGVIPARLASTRLPRKLLLSATGQSLLQHTYDAAAAADVFDRLVIATDDEAIRSVAEGFGAEVVMTSPDCPSGSDRVCEAIDTLGVPDDAIVVNVQGDEPEISPECIRRLLACFQHSDIEVATWAFRITAAEAEDPNLVKVVLDADGRALYFSRARIPLVRDPAALPDALFLGHAGIYAFRARALRRFSELPPTPLEELEKLEQLRLLVAGIPVRVEIGDRPGVGIDTPVDYDRFVARELERQESVASDGQQT